MLIAIPSRGRPTAVKSLAILPSATVYVPENEASAYRASGARSVVGVPASVTGITKTRNWILDSTDDPWVVFIDDDVKAAGWIRLLDESSARQKMCGPEWIEAFLRVFEVTEDLGLRIWGLSTDGATRSVYPYRPFIFHTYVTASCMGIRNDTGIRFDESFPVKEDYELCLRCLKEDGAVVGVRYMFWNNAHWVGDGGCKEYRTQRMEASAIQRLIAMYPGMIRKVTRGGSEYSIELDF